MRRGEDQQYPVHTDSADDQALDGFEEAPALAAVVLGNEEQDAHEQSHCDNCNRNLVIEFVHDLDSTVQGCGHFCHSTVSALLLSGRRAYGLLNQPPNRSGDECRRMPGHHQESGVIGVEELVTEGVLGRVGTTGMELFYEIVGPRFQLATNGCA